MGQINTNNYPTVNSLSDADLLIVENATNGTGTTTPKQLRENAIGTDTLQTSSQTVTGAINELKGEIDAGAGVVRYDVDTITSGYLGQFSGSANLLLLHLTTDGTADATNGYMMMLSYSRPVARFAIGRLVDADGVAYKQDVYADNTIICTISGSGEGTESDPEQVVILGIINAGFMLTPTAVVSDRDIQDGQGNTLSVLAEALTKTASGNPVVITDCAGGKARSLVTSIEPIQDLHGYDKPWVGGGGKNKLPMTVESIKALNVDVGTWSGNKYTINGVSYELQTDADNNLIGIKVTGTATNIAQIYLNISLTHALLPNAMILNGCPTNGSTSSYYMRAQVAGSPWTVLGDDAGSGVNVSIPDDNNNYQVIIRVVSGYAIPSGGLLFKPMIRLSTESDATFAPYSNICPISGRDSVIVDDTGVNIWNEQWEIGGIDATTGQNNNANNCIRCVGYISVIPAQSLYLKFPTGSYKRMVVHWYDQNKNYIAPRSIYDNTIAVTVPSNAYYMRFYMTEEYGTTYGNNISVNYPSTFTDYVPYAHSSATIQLGQTVYGGTINLTTGVATVTHAIHACTGEETISVISASYPNFYIIDDANNAFMRDFRVRISGQNFEIPQVSHYNGGAYADPNNIADGSSICYVGSGGNTIGFKDLRIASVSDFKAYMLAQYTANTPVTFYLPLATPIELTLTPTELQMLKGYNRVTIESGSIELGYIAKLT